MQDDGLSARVHLLIVSVALSRNWTAGAGDRVAGRAWRARSFPSDPSTEMQGNKRLKLLRLLLSPNIRYIVQCDLASLHRSGHSHGLSIWSLTSHLKRAQDSLPGRSQSRAMTLKTQRLLYPHSKGSTRSHGHSRSRDLKASEERLGKRPYVGEQAAPRRQYGFDEIGPSAPDRWLQMQSYIAGIDSSLKELGRSRLEDMYVKFDYTR